MNKTSIEHICKTYSRSYIMPRKLGISYQTLGIIATKSFFRAYKKLHQQTCVYKSPKISMYAYVMSNRGRWI